MSATDGKPCNCELGGVIRFLFVEGVTLEIHRRLCAKYKKDNVYKLRNVYYCIKQFSRGRTNLHDEERSGQPSEAVNKGMINIVGALLAEDERHTVKI